MTTIESLQAEIEELEKRIKAISNAQTLHQSLDSLLNYFQSIKEYLEDVQELLTDANADHTDITTAITTLSSTVSSLAGRITALENAETEVDLTQIESSISNLNTLITNLKDGSNATIADLEDDISDLQTDLGNLEDRVETNEDDISDINTDLGAMQTSINNLTTAQNSLTSTQSNLTSTVSGINSRLTAVETNVNSLTGGVDLSAFQTKLDELDNDCTWKQNYNKYTYDVYCKPKNTDLYIDDIRFSANMYAPITINVKFNYTVNSTTNGTTLRIRAKYNNRTILLDTTVDLTTNTSQFATTVTLGEPGRFHFVRMWLKTSADIIINTMEVEIFASGVMLYNNYRNIDVKCANDKILVCQKNADNIKYSIYDRANISSVSISSFSNQIDKYNSTNQCYYPYMDIVPYAYTSSNTVQEIEFGLIKTSANYNITLEPLLTYTGTNSFFNTTSISINNPFEFTVAGTMYDMPYMFGVIPGIDESCLTAVKITTPNLNRIFSNNNISYNKYWFWCKPVENNNITINSSVTESESSLKLLALFKDGYIYYFSGRSATPIKLGKGIFATGYIEADNSINVYVSDYYNTKRYKLVLNNSTNNYEISATKSYAGYSTIYELYDGKAIGKKGLNNWQVFNTTF